MSKVKLTREQADAIEYKLGRYDSKQRGIDAIIRIHSLINKNKVTWGVCQGERYKSLDCITMEELAKALYIGYEVEETFEVGDWVVPCKEGYFGVDTPQKITKIDEISSHTRHFLEDELWSTKGQLRHATPEEIAAEKERRWWAKHGREVNEIKPNDVLININDTNYNARLVESVHEKGNVKFKGNEGYSPKELIVESYKVICFAEDRKDE